MSEPRAIVVSVEGLAKNLPPDHDHMVIDYHPPTSITTASWTVTTERSWDGSGDPDYIIGTGHTLAAAIADHQRKAR